MSDLFTINEKVQSALGKIFQQYRLVFWYDEKAEMTELFETIQIPGIEKLKIENNEFALKHKIIAEEPKQRFLIYQPSPKPVENENWLLDLLLSNYEFYTEASSLFLQELDLPQEFKGLIQSHEEFFGNQKRVSELKTVLEKDNKYIAGSPETIKNNGYDNRIGFKIFDDGSVTSTAWYKIKVKTNIN